MNKSLFSFLLVFTALSQLFAQDAHFTQSFASPLTLNPALTGAFNGKYRVSMIYRDQWHPVTSSPFQTFSGAIDLRFNSNSKKVQKDVASVGMVFTSDKATLFGFNSNQILLSGAFTKSLNVENSQFLTAAIQAGVGQRNINFDNLNFPNEFNGVNQYNLNSNEKLPANNYAYPDLSTGLNYTYSPKRNTSLYIGGAVHHLLTPTIAFFDKETAGGTKKLERKYSAHASAQLPMGLRNSFLPRVFVAVQGNHAQANLGGNLRLQFTDYGTTAFHLGASARGVRSDKVFGFDAASLMFGFELNNFLLGMSYDVNLKGLGAYNRNQGSFEFSLGYLGDYDNDAILCPKF
jgi:type IX secretion system PorP/SprF family membrane protein